MKNFVGLPLKTVEAELQTSNAAYKVYENNFNVVGNTTLVTNAKTQNSEIVLTVGKFIFDL